jgi:hypothetical protein
LYRWDTCISISLGCMYGWYHIPLYIKFSVCENGKSFSLFNKNLYKIFGVQNFFEWLHSCSWVQCCTTVRRKSAGSLLLYVYFLVFFICFGRSRSVMEASVDMIKNNNCVIKKHDWTRYTLHQIGKKKEPWHRAID